MKVRDVMHGPSPVCAIDATLAEAAGQMLVTDAEMLVVVDDLGGPIGTVTDRDLAVRGYARSLRATTAVAEVMTHALLAARPDDNVYSVASTMAAHGIRQLPIVDRGALVGVVALDDLTSLSGRKLRRSA